MFGATVFLNRGTGTTSAVKLRFNTIIAKYKSKPQNMFFLMWGPLYSSDIVFVNNLILMWDKYF